MNERRISCIMMIVTIISMCSLAGGVERLDSGLVAIPRDDGSVFLSWRSLAPDTTFTLARRTAGQAVVLADRYEGTNFVDEVGRKGTSVYELATGSSRTAVTLTDQSKF